jgi:hypothetical protein
VALSKLDATVIGVLPTQKLRRVIEARSEVHSKGLELLT